MTLVVLYVDDLLISAEDDNHLRALVRSFVCVCLPEGVRGYLRFSGVVREGCVLIGGRVMTQLLYTTPERRAEKLY